MFEFIGLVATISSAVFGYGATKAFVKERLRYVEGVHKPSAAWKAGGAALAVATPVAWLLPFIYVIPTAVIFGASVAAGVRAGSKQIRKTLPGY
jgi:hypothetical protein